MPQVADREQTRSEELREFPITGPFGGIQSELPLDQIENYGFFDTTNFLFRKGVAYIRPSFDILPTFPNPFQSDPILGVADFFNVNGVRIQAVLTNRTLFQWVNNNWTVITGPPFTGSTTQTWDWDVNGGVLCFSQGQDQLFIWDGINPFYTQVATAPAAQYMCEIAQQLFMANTLESGVAHVQRYKWGGVNNPQDWTSFQSGTNDIQNNLGPIRGLKKLGQYGYGWHQWGIMQIQPTGYGPLPFVFSTIANANVGNIAGRSLASFNQNGVEQAAYLAKDNVYVFNQSSVIPIGDSPIEGRRRLGARSRIFSDLSNIDPTTAYGFVTQCIAGQIYNAYWLILPNVSTWAYNFDEGNWTRYQYNGTQTCAGLFNRVATIQIRQLIGTIASQAWSLNNAGDTNPLDGFVLGWNNGQLGYVDFGTYSEVPAQVVSGKHIFNDRRHKHCVKKFRLVVLDQGPTTYTITISSSSGNSISRTVTLGTGSGDSLSYVSSFSISGLRIQWTVSVPAGQPAAIIEFCPIFDIDGEQRGGTQDV